MSGMTFTRARRAQARLRLAIVAVSGGGKTMGSLRLAKGLVEALIDMGVVQGGLEGKIAMIDSERKSASLYADVCPFDTLELEPPYSVDRYMQAVDAAERAGYTVCILDQISHAWAGPGGQLEYVDALKAQSRNAMSPWAKVTPMQQEFYDRILRTPMHIIATMRAKSEWVIDEVMVDGRPKKVPRKIGLSPVQREGIEYEFTACLDVDLEAHMATASKDRTRLFMGRQTLLDEACGRKLAEWLQTGEATTVEPSAGVGASGQASGAAGSQAGNQSNADAERKKLLAQLDDGVDDLLLSYKECSTLPDLAGQFDKAQKFVKSFKDSLGAETCKPYLERVTEAKDKRKVELQAPQHGAAVKPRTILWNQKRETVAEFAAAVKPGDEVPDRDGVIWVVGALAQKAADGETWYAAQKQAAPAGDLLDQADPNKVSVEDMKRLASFATNEGLTEAEMLEALEVKSLAELPKAAYAEATDKILKAARAKLGNKKPARARKEKAAA